MLVISALMYLLAKSLFRSEASTVSKGTAGSASVKLHGIASLLPTLFFLLITLVAALPHIALTLTAFSLKWYGTVLPDHWSLLNFENALSNKLVVPSIVNSLKYSSVAMLVTLAVGLVVALIVQRWKLPFAWLIDAVAMLPLAVPGIVVAFGYLGMSVEYSWASEMFNPQGNPIWLLSIAYAVRRLPYVLRSVSAGLEQTPLEFEEAARTFGAGPVRTLRKITLPLLLPSINTVLTLCLIGGLRSYDLIQALTAGGPGYSSEVLGTTIYKLFARGSYGLATAGNVLLFIAVAVIVFPINSFIAKREADIV